MHAANLVHRADDGRDASYVRVSDGLVILYVGINLTYSDQLHCVTV